MGEDGLALIADDVDGHLIASMRAMLDDVAVAQAMGGAVAGMMREQ